MTMNYLEYLEGPSHQPDRVVMDSTLLTAPTSSSFSSASPLVQVTPPSTHSSSFQLLFVLPSLFAHHSTPQPVN